VRRKILVLIVTFALVMAVFQPAGAAPSGVAPILDADSPSAIPGRFIVVFKDGTSRGDKRAAMQRALAQGAEVRFVYAAALDGFAASLPGKALTGLAHNPQVEYIEADQTVTADTTQTNATWGLDRSDQRYLPLNGTYRYQYTGAGVTAYIIDTGINITHTDFGKRAKYGWDFVDNDATASDCNGHGTHVAGTVGGSTYGVAKGVTLIAIRVLNCSGSGSTSTVIAGINWVTSHHTAGAKAVANLSLGGNPSTSLDSAVKNSIADGVVYAVAAGNNNSNACNYSPARVANAITVGATTSTDARAWYSNYGTCLDLFAPGSSITSDWKSSNTATAILSGTSMSAAHVTGVAALYLQSHTATPGQVRNAIVNGASSGVVRSPGGGSPNKLLYALLP
jgi:subtilisin family serine protease